MKLFFVFLFSFLSGAIGAQCGNGNSFVTGSLTPPGVGQSTSLTFNSGQYVLAHVQTGASYQVSSCGGSTGGGPTYDTQLTVYNDATGTFIAYNDDYCGLQSTVNFTSSFCGYVRILLNQYSCNNSNLPWIVTMTQNSAGTSQTYTLSAVTSQTNISCFGASDGRAEVNPTGVTAPVQYIWAPTGGTGSLATGLSSGVYTVTVTDAACNGTIQTYTITQPSSLTTVSSQTNVSCFGMPNGQGEISVTGGTSPYSYTWSPSGGSAATSGGLASGTYTCSIADANGCNTSTTVAITEPPVLAISATSGSVSCFGGSNGTASVSVSGGTAPYSYDWAPGTPTGDGTSAVSGLTSGTWSCSVTDNMGCTISTTITVAEPPALNSTVTATNVLCSGANTGSSFVSVSGGVPGYTYTWSPSGGNTATAGSLAAGNYSVMITDANGCTATNSITISQPATAVSSATIASDVACHGGSTGSATVTASGGTGSYTYLWSTAATSAVITGQTAGVKTVTVTDANGCNSFNSVNIAQPLSPLAATQTQTNVTCTINGNAAVSVNGGTLPYSYTWSPSGGNAASSSTLAPGNYTCVTQDGNNCLLSSLFTITANTVAPTVAISGSSVVCAGTTVTLTASGADTYSWNTGATNPSISVTPSSSTVYSVTGTTTINGCISSAMHTLTVNPNPTLTATAGNTIICTTQSTTITAGGASTYTWSTGSNATSIVVTPASTTTYTLNGSNPTGCSGNTTIQITVVNTPTVTASSSNPTICAGASSTLTASGATTYSWSTGATGSSIVVNPSTNTSYLVNGMVSAGCNSNATVSLVVNANPTVNIAVSQASVCPGQTSTLTASGASTYSWNTGSNATSITSTPAVPVTYTVTGSNAAGCTNTSVQTIGLFPAPSINMVHIGSPSPSVCAGSSSTLTAGGAATFTWSTGSNNPTIVITPANTTTYSVNGTDVNGCNASGSITIGINGTPTLSAVASSTGICAGNSSNLNVTGAISYLWSTGDTGTSISVSPVATTIYTVSGTNSAGCVSTLTLDVFVYPDPTVALGPDIEVTSGTAYQFNPVQSGAISYTWSPATYLSSNTLPDPVMTAEEDITYVLAATSANGCMTADTIVVKVLKDLTLANYMSPNGDGQNDTWKVSSTALIRDYSITIVDSYGKTVFSVESNYNNEFDGKLGGQDLPDGVYYYFIKGGNDTKYKGSITLTR